MTRSASIEAAARALLSALCTGTEPHDWDAIDALVRALRAALSLPEDAPAGEVPVAWAICNPKHAHPVIDRSEVVIRSMAGMDGDVVRPLVYGDTHPTPPPGEVEKAREAFVRVAREWCSGAEWDEDFSIDRDFLAAYNALCRAEAAAKAKGVDRG